MQFKDFQQMTRQSSFAPHYDWESIEHTLSRWMNDREPMAKLDIDPVFQRGHVWTVRQQQEYVKHILRGGGVSTGVNTIRFNCVGWNRDYRGPFVLVDGKQRLEAVRKFMRNELLIPILREDVADTYKGQLYRKGLRYSDFEGRLPSTCCFIFMVNNLETEAEVLKWYLEINEGGTPHSAQEIEKVRELVKNTSY